MSASPAEPERRPLAVRQRAWARAVSSWLARRGASPNGISLAGLGCALLAGALLGWASHLGGWGRAGYLAAGLLIQGRLLANLFDGMVAIESGKASRLGELFNEVPDRLSDVAILVGAGYAAGWPELGYLAGCLALFIAYVRAEGRVAGAHQEYCGPMAKQQRMVVVTAACALCAVLPEAWREEPAGLGVMGAALVV